MGWPGKVAGHGMLKNALFVEVSWQLLGRRIGGGKHSRAGKVEYTWEPLF